MMSHQMSSSTQFNMTADFNHCDGDEVARQELMLGPPDDDDIQNQEAIDALSFKPIERFSAIDNEADF